MPPSQAPSRNEEAAAAQPSLPMGRSWLVPAIVGGIVLIVSAGSIAWWPAPPVTSQQGAAGGSQHSGREAAAGGARAVARNLSSVEAEARDAAEAEMARHWLKGPDGWTTVLSEGEGTLFPQRFLRQFREMTVESVEANELSAADRLNGFDWIGTVSFRTGACREVGDPGQAFSSLGIMYRSGIDRPRGRWTEWLVVQPQPLDVSRVNGVWRVQAGEVDTRTGEPVRKGQRENPLALIFLREPVTVLRGKPATLEDFQRAGVK
jgi:hypothetical protein